MNISNLTLQELKSLLAELPNEIARREKLEKVEARRALEAFAAEKGFTLSELMDDSKPAKTRRSGPVAIKYRQGENSWTGRGRKPKWVEAHLAAGGTLEQIAA